MANIKSQKKRVLTNEKAHKRNVAVKSGLKTAVRATREAIAAGDKAAAEAAYKVAAQKLDKAAGAGLSSLPSSSLSGWMTGRFRYFDSPGRYVLCRARAPGN